MSYIRYQTLKHRRPYNLWPVLVYLVAILSLQIATSSAAENALEQSLEIRTNSTHNSIASQKKIDQLSEQTKALYTEYKKNLMQLDSLKIYDNNLEKLVESQKKEISSYNTQLTQIDDTQRDVIPLMIKMVDTLDEFIRLDQPFLLKERKSRVLALKNLLTRSDVSTSEKYRRVMEAYQVEMEYGRTIEAYRDTLESNDGKRTVDIFRLGRVALFYQTLDGQETGAWDKQTLKWTPISSEYRLTVNKGLRMARKQSAPDLLILPISAPEHAQ